MPATVVRFAQVLGTEGGRLTCAAYEAVLSEDGLEEPREVARVRATSRGGRISRGLRGLFRRYPLAAAAVWDAADSVRDKLLKS